LTVICSRANGIGIGSVLELWAYRPRKI